MTKCGECSIVTIKVWLEMLDKRMLDTGPRNTFKSSMDSVVLGTEVNLAYHQESAL